MKKRELLRRIEELETQIISLRARVAVLERSLVNPQRTITDWWVYGDDSCWHRVSQSAFELSPLERAMTGDNP